MGETSFLRLEGLTRRFDGTAAVDRLSLAVHEQEIFTLLGPSGCGKTTTLRMVAGFERPDAGQVYLEGREISSLPPQRRGFGMVFQHYALFPHLSVGENVGFGLESSDLSGDDRERRIRRALELVGLPGFQGRTVSSLSGGQQQRVALARALAPEPRVLLLDEPLSNLDAALRERTRRELRALVKEIGITTLYVTHDQEEAFELSDRIAVMRGGRLDQVGPAEELYHGPSTEFVAGFLGRVGRAAATVRGRDGTTTEVALSGGPVWEVRCPDGPGPSAGDTVTLLARPEALRLTDPDEPMAVAGRVLARRFAGSFYLYRIEIEDGTLEVQAERGTTREGERVGVEPSAPPQGLHIFPVTGPSS